MADNLTIALGTGATADTATKDVGGVHYQIHYMGKTSRSDTYTVTANGTQVDVSKMGAQSFGIQVKCTTAVATSWTVLLEGSLDGTNYSTISTHATANGDGTVIWTNAVLTPCLYFRSRCTELTLGSATNIVVTIVGM